MVYKFFQGKSPHLSSTFKYLNYNCKPLGLASKTYDLSVSRTFHIPLSIFSSYAHDQLGNCWTFPSFKRFIFFYVVYYAFMNYLVTDSSFGSVPLSPSMLSFPLSVLLTTVRPELQCLATPSRLGSPTNPLSPLANKPKCIIHWICVPKQSNKLYY